MKKIYYLNAMMDPAIGQVFTDGILTAHARHKNAGDFEIREKSFFYGPSKISPLEMPRLLLEDDVIGIILSGSEKNTSDPFDPWVRDYIRGLQGLLGLPKDPFEDWAGPQVPIFGICFGHQALAVALGGEVSRFSYQSGFKDVIPRHQSANHRVFKNLFKTFPKSFRLGVTHGDHVVRLPKGLHLLATSQYCDCQAFAHDQWDIVGVQSHPEITDEIRNVEDHWKTSTDEDFQRQHGPLILDSMMSWMLKR